MTEKSKTRRWFHFRLRTLLIVVLLVGVILAPVARKRIEYNRQKAILDQLVADGPRIIYGPDYGPWWHHVYDGVP